MIPFLFCPFPASVIYKIGTHALLECPLHSPVPSSFSHFELHASFLITSLLKAAELYVSVSAGPNINSSETRVGAVVLRCWSQHLSSTFKALSVPESTLRREDVQAACQLVRLFLHGPLLLGVTVQVRFRIRRQE